MQDFEKLGVFYLGKVYDPQAGRPADDLLLYDARDLTTHAVCVGMTGSGKTGLGVTLLEEAAIDGIPALVIDPKGDLGNLLLTFPNLAPADFRPWVDEAEAARKGLAPDDYAAQVAANWRKGLADWGQDAARIARLRDAVEMTIYTPGAEAGVPLSILRSFAAPPPELLADGSALRDRISATVSGILGLLGLAADPLQSREHILLANLLDRAWRDGRDLDLPGLIQAVQKPPFEKVGVFDLESFFPAKDRFGLAMALNNLLAAPGFADWHAGEPLDIQRLLYSPAGKPRLAIISIAHLSDAERMFFVTLLLNETLAWMRRQPGTSSLRALLYMDEIFGYFPPTATPPAKLPMLTLLKQARAFGLGIVLATQNPVDLDYKGLANAGTWLIGRLQTERDKARVLEGLEGALAASGGFDRAAMEKLIAALGQRVFLMRNVHEDQPVLFQTRWTLSYLRGPLTLPQIRQLSGTQPTAAPATPAPAAAGSAGPAAAIGGGTRPVLPAGIAEYFLRPTDPAAETVYRPAVMGAARLHFADAKYELDTWETAVFLAPFTDDGQAADWSRAERRADLKAGLERGPREPARYAELPAAATRAPNYAAWGRELEAHIYQNVVLDLFESLRLKLVSRPGENAGDFSVRIAQRLREIRDEEVERLRRKYAPRLTTLEDQIRRANERVAREKAQYGQRQTDTLISVGATILGAFFGRRAISTGTIGRASTAARGYGRMSKERADVDHATENLAVLQERLAALQNEFEQEAARIQGEYDPAAAQIEEVQVRPRKSDIMVNEIALVWLPHTASI